MNNESYRILFGIPAMIPKNIPLTDRKRIEDYEVIDDTDVWCDFQVYLNQKTNTYHIELETLLGFETSDGCRNWVVSCIKEFKEYMIRHGYDTSKELSLYDVFCEGINVNTAFESVEDVYAFLKLVAYGFHGDGYDVVIRSEA